MIELTEEISKAILNLEGNPNWEILKNRWFRKSLSETKGPHEAIYTKGMQDQIIDMMDKIENAMESLRQIELRKPKK